MATVLDDEAPDVVSFATSKQQVLDQAKSAARSVREEKSRLKERRKVKEALYSEQKRQKLARLNELRHRANECMRKPAATPKQDRGLEQQQEEPSVDGPKTGPPEPPKSVKTGKDPRQFTRGSTQFRIVTYRECTDIDSRVPASIRNFRAAALFGEGCKIRRESAAAALRKQQKRALLSGK